jgi:hypothetical protein
MKLITGSSAWLKTIVRVRVDPISGRLLDARVSITSVSQRRTSPG